MNTFESLFQIAARLAIPTADDDRELEWCDSGRSVALAREASGRREVFVSGPELVARTSLVRRHLRHDRWRNRVGEEFEANRIVLPDEDHFVAVAALVVEQLVRYGVAEERQRAFAAVEPLIEMALRGGALQENTILGLVGELVFLEWLLRGAASPTQKAACIAAWEGYEHAARDFAFTNRSSVEVKVTRGVHSRHHIQSLAQVDPQRDGSGQPVEDLWLLSFCLEPDDGGGNGELLSLPDQVDAILELLGPSDPRLRTEVQALFLAFVAKYGVSSGSGYVHDEMKEWAAYSTRWHLRSCRAYDMSDDSIGVLRLADVERRAFTPPESVSFDVDLPSELETPDNPVTDVQGFAARLASLSD